MARIANPEQYAASKESKGELKYSERSRWLLFGLPWTFTKYEIRDNDFTIIKGFLQSERMTATCIRSVM